MGFKFEAPFKMPRFTSEEFKKLKAEYQAKHGYTIHVPGFEDIIKWDTTPEPDKRELALYKAKKVHELGEKRYEEIKRLMVKKREKFLRLLSSPSPNIVQNASSILTALDNVNDALGTFAVIGRIVARKVPAMFGKAILGPAGWALTVAEIASVAQQVMCLPYKPRVIQHELNEMVRGHPLSKKAKLVRMKKLLRLKLTKGEIIEGLQTTENMFGIGVSLGPIMGLLWDIPAGLYRHMKGEKVVIKGLPAPLLWFDKVWANLLKSAATLWTGLPIELDEDLTTFMTSLNLATMAARVNFKEFNPLDKILEVNLIELPAPAPEHPSTVSIITDILGDIKRKIGWPFSGEEWISTTHIFETGLDQIQENLVNWRERNKMSTEGMIAAQNQVDAGLQIIGALEGDDALELEYDPHTHMMLKLLNQGYRYPCLMEEEQVNCLQKALEEYNVIYGEPDYREGLRMARELCCFEFVTDYPKMGEKRMDLATMPKAWIEANAFAVRLRLLTHIAHVSSSGSAHFTLRASVYNIRRITMLLDWFKEYMWPKGHPTTHLCKDMEIGMLKMFNNIGIPVTKTRCCSVHLVPFFSLDMLPANLAPVPGSPMDPDINIRGIYKRITFYADQMSVGTGGFTATQVLTRKKWISYGIYTLQETAWPEDEPSFERLLRFKDALENCFERTGWPIITTLTIEGVILPMLGPKTLPPLVRRIVI